MDFNEIYQLLRSLWLVWMLVLFAGIVVWVMWPRNKNKLEAQAQIPFKNDELE
jgi:cytochrome c oxidase cbb3-type subunit IV